MLRRLILPLVSILWTLHAEPAAAKKKPEAKPASPAEAALDAAKRDWQALKADAKHSKYRSNWLKVASEFGAVARGYPKSPEAAKALFDAGELYEDLSRISWIQDDVDLAAAAYGRVAKAYTTSPLADDAMLALARIYIGRKNDSEHARAELKLLLKMYPKGDVAPQARALLAQLPKDEVDAKPRALAKAEPKKAEAKPEPKVEAKPEPKPAPAAVAVAEKKAPAVEPAPTVKEVDAQWDESEPSAPPRPVALIDAAAIDGSMDEELVAAEPAKAELARAELVKPEAAKPELAKADPVAKVAAAPELPPLEAVKLKAHDKDRLAALATAVKGSEDLPLSAQMGLKVRRVVIDAGHGGHDTGAIGPTGVNEKDVTLAVAKKLADKLRGQGLEVFLSRPDDHFVSLENRVAFANEHRADLFISVHCNAAAQASLRGVETYSLNVASNRYAMRLAARENASSERSISDLQFLLADIATRANTVDSRRLAGMVQRSVVNGLSTRYGKVRDLGPKEALFYVLLGAHMPAILVEGSFISNPTDEQRLIDADFQDQLATSIAGGVERFVSDHQALATAGLP